MKKEEVKVDSRGHVSLSWRSRKDYTRYLATEDQDGVITLMPAELVPARRLRQPPLGHGVIEAIEGLGYPPEKEKEWS